MHHIQINRGFYQWNSLSLQNFVDKENIDKSITKTVWMTSWVGISAENSIFNFHSVSNRRNSIAMWIFFIYFHLSFCQFPCSVPYILLYPMIHFRKKQFKHGFVLYLTEQFSHSVGRLFVRMTEWNLMNDISHGCVVWNIVERSWTI